MLHDRAPESPVRRHAARRAAVVISLVAVLVAALAPAGASAVVGTTISGKVTSTTGAALAGITVQAGTVANSGWTGVGSATTTAADGTYSVTVGSGRFAIRFSEASQAHAAGYYSTAGFVPDVPSASLILVGSVAVTGINIHLPIAYTISGTVTGPGAVPLANIAVDAINRSGVQEASATTNGSGAYTIHAASGSYVLRFTDPTKTYPSGYYTATGLTTDLSAAAGIDLGTTNITGKNIQLPAARHISGVVTDTLASPLVGITVSAGLSTATTTAGGAYTLTVSPGSYAVIVQDTTNVHASGYYRSGNPSLTTSLASATAVDVTAADASSIDVQLPTGVLVSGTVTGTGGAPLAGVNVWLMSVGSTEALSIVTTSGTGTYSVRAATGSFILKFVEATGAYSAGFYRSGVSGSFTRDMSVATAIAVASSPVAVATVQLPLYNTVDRQSGADRYATAANISRGTVRSGAPVVYIATALNFPDALAAAAAAGYLGGPVLLVTTTTIPDVTKTELTRLSPARIIVAGGTGVVSNSVMTQLATYTSGTVERQSGADRYATAASISAHTFAPGAPIAYVATGLNFPDALAAAAAAARLGGPVLLVTQSSIPAATQTELLRLKPARIVVAGGSGVVADSVLTQLAAFTAGTVERQYGANRYATAAAVSAHVFAPGAPIAYVATGLNFPDALAAAAAAGRLGGPVLLVQTGTIPAETKTELTRLKPARIVIAGGTGVVTNAVMTQLSGYLAP
jgi:putative cell wall-binding protein